MATITNNNVQNVKFLRNGTLFASHDLAYNALTGFTLTDEQDGTAILARYTAQDTNVKTLVGLVYKNGATSYVTIIDVEGASGDVEKLRREINAKLGSGITSANTATAQLAALSGGTFVPGTSSSADTSVEGAKAYAYNLIGTLDYEDAAVAGQYVSQVTQADGKIAVTRVELPTVGAITQPGKPIIAVAEDKGTIAASAGTIDAQYVNIADSGEKFTATTVEGALAELGTKIEGLDYTGVTTGDGVVITNVTEEDGVVSAASANVGGLKLTDYTKGSDSGSVAATDSINQAFSKLEKQIDAEKDARAAAIDALDSPDSAVVKKFVTSVSEENGVISVSRGEVTSTDKTVVLTDGSDGGIDLAVHIDNSTLQKDENGVISVTSSALVQYEGDGDTVQIGAVQAGVRTVSSPLTISATTPTDSNVREQYNLVGASGNTIGATIKIYKDSALYNVYLGHVDDTITSPTDPTVVPGTGDTALCFIYHKEDGTYQLVTVNVEDFIEENEFASGVTWDSGATKVRGVVDPTSEGFLTVGADGFKLSGVQNAIDTAVSGAVETLDADVSGNSTHVTVGVEEVNGKITAVTVSEDNIANANDLAGLSAKTVTAITSNNASITAQINDAAGNKQYNIETDASKIKMSGFTSTDPSGFTEITEDSTVTEAVEAIEAAFIENEEVVAAALTDLDGRVDTVSGKVDTIEAQYVSGVSVNGSAVTVANHVAPISITAATSATIATSTEAITVQTDANGNITLGLATIDAGLY